MSRGTTADIDPSQWSIVDGMLYLNLNKQVKETWAQDMAGNITKADRNWPEVLKK